MPLRWPDTARLIAEELSINPQQSFNQALKAFFMNKNPGMSNQNGHSSLSFLKRDASSASAAPWLLVLLHGVGSNERDLFGLASSVPADFHVLSLRAPNVLAPGSYAWFQFGVSAQGTRVINQAQEAASRQQLAQTIAGWSEELGVPPDRVVVGGFSQGGIMALSLLLTQPELMHAAMVMHSRLLDEVKPLIAEPARLAGRQLWVSHGTADDVLPLAYAHATRAAVAALPITLRYEEFANRHEITPDELGQAMAWLQSLMVQAERPIQVTE
jgi:phospholipase/carboxylesterase